jgi:hypothetical protein
VRTYDEQRQWPRWTRASEHQVSAVRLRPGRAASVMDVSASGALIEAPGRLEPGSIVDLQVTRADRIVNVRSRVVRSSVSRLLADAIWYRAGVAFERQLAWLVDGPSSATWGRTTRAANGWPGALGDNEPISVSFGDR